MNTKFVDPEYMRQVVEEQEEALQVKTGIRAGQVDPPPGPIVCYGVEPLPGPIYA